MSSTSHSAPTGLSAGKGPSGGSEAMSALLARNWWALALRGAAAIMFGVVAFLVPAAAMLTLALFFAAYLLVDGIFGIIAAARAARADQRWGMLLAEAVLNIVMGLIAFVFPVTAVLAFVIVTAVWSLITGGLMLAAAWKLTQAHGRWWMALSGAVSILFGIALAVAPLVGAVVLTWWLAGYALAFGAMMLILAFKLRARRGVSKDHGASAA